MKKSIKGFVLGVIITTLLMSTVLGTGVKENIEVLFNSINLTVNGSKVDADTIVYKGTTYVPLRAAGEMLGKEVGWDGATNTASINDKGIKPIPVSKDGVKVYEDDKVKVSYSKVTKDGMEFMVENKTDVVVTVFADTLAINGISISDHIFLADDVSPKSKGIITADFETKDFIGKVKTISGQLKVHDYHTQTFEIIKVSFVNVKVN